MRGLISCYCYQKMTVLFWIFLAIFTPDMHYYTFLLYVRSPIQLSHLSGLIDSFNAINLSLILARLVCSHLYPLIKDLLRYCGWELCHVATGFLDHFKNTHKGCHDSEQPWEQHIVYAKLPIILGLRTGSLERLRKVLLEIV